MLQVIQSWIVPLAATVILEFLLSIKSLLTKQVLIGQTSPRKLCQIAVASIVVQNENLTPLLSEIKVITHRKWRRQLSPRCCFIRITT